MSYTLNMKKSFATYLLVTLILINLITCYEDKESLQKRINFYQKIPLYSNNTISVGVSPTRGLSCVANDFIEYGRRIMQIPKKMSLCPYFLFPFKYEISEILMEIPGMKDTLAREQKFSVYLLTYYILYFVYAPKEEIKRYIHEKNLQEYFNIEDIDESLKDSFPQIMLNSATLETEHYDLLKKLGYPMDKGQELDAVFKWVNQKVYNLEHMEAIFPWMSNFDQFRWAYSIVMSRGMTLRLSEYFILDEVKEKQRTYDKWQKKNLEENKKFSTQVGVPCVIAFIDLCNHHQPSNLDLRDKRPIILDAIPKYFINTVATTYQSGQELTYTYTNEPSNAMLFLHYGFVIRDNIFNMVKMNIEDDLSLTLAQFNLCKELGCVDSQIKDPSKLPRIRQTTVRNAKLDETLINYARVRYLKPDFDQKKIIKIITNDKPISYENESQAWLFYFNNCLKIMKEERIDLRKSVRKAQKYRNMCTEIESNWKDDEEQRAQWRKFKSYENIYFMDVSYRKIMYRHLIGSINRVITSAAPELTNLKNKYLS